MNPKQDKTLVSQICQGDPAAFAELVDRYSPRLFGACLGFLGNVQDAEDCVQDAWIKVYRNIGSFRGGSSLFTWIYRIAMNCCHDNLRRRNHTRTYSLDDNLETENGQITVQFADDKPLPDEVVEQRQFATFIRQEIAALKPSLREIIVMRDLLGYTYEEISGLLGLKEGTVKSRLSRARNQLAKNIRKREQDASSLRLTNEKSD